MDWVLSLCYSHAGLLPKIPDQTKDEGIADIMAAELALLNPDLSGTLSQICRTINLAAGWATSAFMGHVQSCCN